MTFSIGRRRPRNIRTFDVQYLWSNFREGALQLRPDFQRNAIWPTAAKSYLIDTLIRGLPTPLVFVYRTAVPDSGMPGLAVVDGQQRLSAIFDFLEGRFRLSGRDISQFNGMGFDRLPQEAKEAILHYGVVVEELPDHTPTEIRDIFTRLNRYGVRLSPQELRHARDDGKFKRAVEEVGAWEFWTQERIISPTKARRMRSDEFAAELLILLAEGAPQDKKAAIDQYYVAYQAAFPQRAELTTRLQRFLSWAADVLPATSRFRKTVDFYSLVGAVDRESQQGAKLHSLSESKSRRALEKFASEVTQGSTRRAARYLNAASRQTDNYIPRRTRIDILADVVSGDTP